MMRRIALVSVLVALVPLVAWADWPELRRRDAERQEALRPKLKLIPKGHPRLFIRGEDDLEAVRERIKSSPEVAEAYAALREWAYSGAFTTGGWQPTPQLQARIVVYRIEKRDPELLAPILEQMDWLCENDLDEWSWSWIGKSLAMGYDWLYDDLTPAQREKYGRRALECTKEVYRIWQHPPTNNHVYLKQGKVLYAGIALYGDGIDDAAAEQMVLDGLEQQLMLFIPCHNILNAGDGGWQESMSYHSMFTYAFAHALEAWQSASGEDIWGEFYGLDGDAHYCLYLRRPFDNRKIRLADGGGNAVDTYISYYTPLLSRRRRDGVARYWSDWIKERCRQTDDEGKTTLRSPHKWWPYVLWYDPTVPTVTPEELPLARIFRGLGYVVSLSGWEEDAVFSAFLCQPWWCGGHQHLDANSFIIHRYAPLAVDDGTLGYNDTRGNYFARTIAHNTVTVYDPNEEFAGGLWGGRMNEPVANDGGHAYGGGGASMPGDFVENGPYHRGRILSFIHKPEYSYVVGDATRYFKEYKVKEHQRAFLHVQPDLFIVFDRVESTDPAFKKRWLLHTKTEPQVQGSTLGVTNSDGRLWCQTLLPSDPEVVVVEPVVLEEGKRIPDVDVTQYPPGYPGQWRIEISPREPAKRDYFLHVLSAPAKGVTERPQATVTQTDGSVTATVTWAGKTVVVRFPKTGELVGHLTITDRQGKVLVGDQFPETGELVGRLIITDRQGKVLVGDQLDQRVQNNEELIKAAQGR